MLWTSSITYFLLSMWSTWSLLNKTLILIRVPYHFYIYYGVRSVIQHGDLHHNNIQDDTKHSDIHHYDIWRCSFIIEQVASNKSSLLWRYKYKEHKLFTMIKIFFEKNIYWKKLLKCQDERLGWKELVWLFKRGKKRKHFKWK